jgi:hypothetical protein
MCSRCKAFGLCSSLPLRMERISKIMIRKALGVVNMSILYKDCCEPSEYELCFGSGKYTIEQIDAVLDKAMLHCQFSQ